MVLQFKARLTWFKIYRPHPHVILGKEQIHYFSFAYFFRPGISIVPQRVHNHGIKKLSKDSFLMVLCFYEIACVE